MMKRVFFYTDTPHVGGAEKQMLLLAKHLSKRGIRVNLAYGKYSRIRDMRDEFARVCEKVFELNALHKHDPRHYFELKRLLRNEKPDLVHLHLWNPGACRWAFFAATREKAPVVTTEHDPFELKGLKRAVKKMCLKRTAHTIAVSETGRRDLQEWYGIPDEKVSVVHNGIELERFLECREKAPLPVQPGDIVITCVAELHERKGHRYLLEAFSRLQKNTPTLRLMLVGLGPLQRELEARYGNNDHIHFLGWRDDVAEILRASDIFVLPSLKEAFGLSVIEAMASGVAVIATASGGVPEIIENGKSGILVPPASSEKLAEAISALLHHPDQKRAIEAMAKERAKIFTAERMAEGTAQVYETI
ncbi:MAG: glycosyltransferase family 4 protein [Candidatus Peregrinibacteria bacterium]